MPIFKTLIIRKNVRVFLFSSFFCECVCCITGMLICCCSQLFKISLYRINQDFIPNLWLSSLQTLIFIANSLKVIIIDKRIYISFFYVLIRRSIRELRSEWYVGLSNLLSESFFFVGYRLN